MKEKFALLRTVLPVRPATDQAAADRFPDGDIFLRPILRSQDMFRASKNFLISLRITAILFCLCSFQAKASGSENVRIAQRVNVKWIRPGEGFFIAIELNMKEGWHTYWKNPGDSGLATDINWDLPPGLSAGDMLWPTPESFRTDDIVNFGYTDKAVFIIPFFSSPGLAPGEVQIKARLSWLECNEACLPGSERLTLRIPVKSDNEHRDILAEAYFDKARADLPRQEGVTLESLSLSGERLFLKLAFARANLTNIDRVEFFGEEDFINYRSPPDFEAYPENRLHLALKCFPDNITAKTALSGVLVIYQNHATFNERQSFVLTIPDISSVTQGRDLD